MHTRLKPDEKTSFSVVGSISTNTVVASLFCNIYPCNIVSSIGTMDVSGPSLNRKNTVTSQLNFLPHYTTKQTSILQFQRRGEHLVSNHTCISLSNLL